MSPNYELTHSYFTKLPQKDKHEEIFSHWNFSKDGNCMTDEHDVVINYSCKDSFCDLSNVTNILKTTIRDRDRMNVISDIITDIADNQSKYLPHIITNYVIKSGGHTIKLQRDTTSNDCVSGTICTDNLPLSQPKRSSVFEYV